MSILMTIFLIISNILIVLGIGFIVAKLLIKPKRMRQTDARQIAEGLLEGIPYNIDENGEHFIHYNFEFGHQHYVLFVPKSGHEAYLYYYHFFVAPANEISLVGSVTNIVNSQINNHTVHYVIDDESNEVVAHACSSILLNDGIGVKDIFFNILSDCWDVKHHFLSVYNEMKAHSKRSDYTNPDTELAENSRELFYLRSHELWQQDFKPVEKTAAPAITLQEVLDFWEPTSGFQLEELILSADNATMVFDNEDIKDYMLLSPIIGLNEERQPYLKHDFISATLILKHKQTDTPRPQRVMLMLENDGKDKSAIYIRVTLCMPTPPMDGHITPTIKEGLKTAFTFLVAYDLTDEKSRREKVDYIYTEALDKISEDREKDLTDEERLLIQVSDDKNVFALYWGMQHYLNGRFYEAIRMLRPLWDHFNRQYHPPSEEAPSLLTTLSYRLGMCYLCLGESEKAFYYLDAAAENFHPVITTEYLNCLVNNADFRAYSIISKVEKIVAEMPDGSDEKVRFENFVLRCKIRLKIQRGDYIGARALLKPMLDDSDSVDFAIQALSYIDKLAPNQSGEDDLPF